MTDPLVLLTRPAGEADPLAAVLVGRGIRVVTIPTVELRPEPAGGALDAALREPWDWIVVTSATGARAVADAARRVPPRTAHWAAVGPATAAALAAAGLRADLVARRASGSDLASDLFATSPTGRLDGTRILLARASMAASDLPSALRAAGADVADVVAYRTVEAPPAAAAPLLAALRDPALSAIVVASGSAVRGLVALGADPSEPRAGDTVAQSASAVRRVGRPGRESEPALGGAAIGGTIRRLAQIPLVAIGPSTAAVAASLGFQHVVVAATPSVVALADAVEAAVARLSTVLTRSTP